jgi:uncharacterized membrane protein
MNTPNKVLMAQARESLNGKWRFAINVILLIFLIELLLRNVAHIGPLIAIIIAGPMMIGTYGFWLAFSRGHDPKIRQVFDGLVEGVWERGLVAYFLVIVFIFVRFLLLIVPGIIAIFAYSQTFYILADHKDMDPIDAIHKSKEMMRGHKWELFYLSCRFIGWAILSILTCGIGFLWLAPYVNVTMAKFYDDIK